jgi:hypothetical protein
MSNKTSSIQAPWGYEYLNTQKAANDVYIYQNIQSLTLYALLVHIFEKGAWNSATKLTCDII